MPVFDKTSASPPGKISQHIRTSGQLANDSLRFGVRVSDIAVSLRMVAHAAAKFQNVQSATRLRVNLRPFLTQFAASAPDCLNGIAIDRYFMSCVSAAIVSPRNQRLNHRKARGIDNEEVIPLERDDETYQSIPYHYHYPDFTLEDDKYFT